MASAVQHQQRILNRGLMSHVLARIEKLWWNQT
jgi:hypothetical protein